MAVAWAFALFSGGCAAASDAVGSVAEPNDISVYTWPEKPGDTPEMWASCNPGYVLEAAQCSASNGARTWSREEDGGRTFRCGISGEVSEEMTLQSILKCVPLAEGAPQT